VEWSNKEFQNRLNSDEIARKEYMERFGCRNCVVSPNGFQFEYSDKGISHKGKFVTPTNFPSECLFFATEDGIKVILPDGAVLEKISSTDGVTIKTDYGGATLPNGVKINGILDFEKGVPVVRAGNSVIYGEYVIDQLLSNNDVYIFSQQPSQSSIYNDKNYVVINDQELTINSIPGSKIGLEIMPGNELFNTFKNSLPDLKDSLKIIVSDGDRIEVKSREDEDRVPLLKHISSEHGKTIIENGELPIELDKDGIRMQTGKLNEFYESVAYPESIEEAQKLFEKRKESVALEIESDSEKAKNLILRVGSANTFEFYEKSEKSPRLIFDSYGFPISDRISDNLFQSVDDLTLKYPNIYFEDQGASPFLVQAVNKWLEEHKPRVIKKITLHPGLKTAADYDKQMILGESMIRLTYIPERTTRVNIYESLDHEYTHLIIHYLTIEGEDEIIESLETEIEKLELEISKLPLNSLDKTELEQELKYLKEKRRKKLGFDKDLTLEESSLRRIDKKIEHYTKLTEEHLKNNPEKVNKEFNQIKDHLNSLTSEEKEELYELAELFLNTYKNRWYESQKYTYLDYDEDISGEKLISDVEASIDQILTGKKPDIEIFAIRGILTFSGQKSRNPRINEMRLQGNRLTKAIEQTIGMGSYSIRTYENYLGRDELGEEFLSTFVDKEDTKITQYINSQDEFVREINLVRLQMSYDIEAINEERYLKLMNSQTPGCTTGNCFCDVNPGKCGKCLEYVRGCDEDA